MENLTKKQIRERNEAIYSDFMHGVSVAEISYRYHLDPNIIRDIVQIVGARIRTKEIKRDAIEFNDLDTYLQKIHTMGMTYAQAQVKETCAKYQHFDRVVY